jgi:hypothetical protein
LDGNIAKKQCIRGDPKRLTGIYFSNSIDCEYVATREI